MDKINFQNLPDQTTPVNASNMNLLQTNVENGILDASLAVYGDSYIDPDTTLYPLILTRNTNGPEGTGNLFYIQTIFYNTRSTTSSRMQVAYGYALDMQFQRYYYNGSWSSWKEVAVQMEGTWTPTISTLEGAAPTMTYEVRTGRYKRYGKMVHIAFYCKGKITALTGTDNYGLISGLPFTALSNTYFSSNVIPIGQLYHLTSSTQNVALLPYPGSSYLRIQFGYGSSANKLIVTDADYFIIAASGWYETA